MPSASARRLRELALLFTHHGLKVETLPSLEELASGRVRASRIRPVEVQDLLGREAVNLDSAGIKHAIENRCVLVTGAGGSIGSELCRQIAALNPKRLLLVQQAAGGNSTDGRRSRAIRDKRHDAREYNYSERFEPAG